MKNIDRIRKYIVTRREQGILMPGDKLPSYKAMMEMFDISYLTVSSIINKLAEEGLVETRRGQGSYIAGSGRLKVLINIHPTTISFADMRKLVRPMVGRPRPYDGLPLDVYRHGLVSEALEFDSGAYAV